MKKDTFVIHKNNKKMSTSELEKYYSEVRKSCHVFKDRSKYDKKKERQKNYRSEY